MGNIKRIILSGLTFRVFGGRFECGGVEHFLRYQFPTVFNCSMSFEFFVPLTASLYSKRADHDLFHPHLLETTFYFNISPVFLFANKYG